MRDGRQVPKQSKEMPKRTVSPISTLSTHYTTFSSAVYTSLVTSPLATLAELQSPPTANPSNTATSQRCLGRRGGRGGGRGGGDREGTAGRPFVRLRSEDVSKVAVGHPAL